MARQAVGLLIASLSTQAVVYSLLNCLQLLAGLAVQLLVARHLGASDSSDAYFIALTVVSVVLGLGGVLSETLVQVYLRLKHGDPSLARALYRCVFSLSLLLGILIAALVSLFPQGVVSLVASGLSEERKLHAIEFLTPASWMLVPLLVSRVNVLVLNAEQRFAYAYVTPLILHIVNVGALVALVPTHGVEVLPYALVVGPAIAVAVQLFSMARVLKLIPSPVLWHPSLPELLRSSVLTQSGHQIYALKDLIIANLLSYGQSGVISIFNYAFRVGSVIFALASAVALQRFTSTISALAAQESWTGVAERTRQTIIRSVGLFGLLLALAIVVLPVLRPYGERFLSPFEVLTIIEMFWLLAPYFLLLTIELPYVQIMIATQRSGVIVRIALVFVLVFLPLAVLATSVVGPQGIAAALCLAQLTNTLSYIRSASGRLKELTS